ncbi:hypothetical protein L218DRAFT_849619 [Marasmius fiardii PR-910]|nr:hypothetical protein L218DRAFT_849619 [Marasmius fiardii PR-910]
MRLKLFLATLPLLSLSSQVPFETRPPASPSFSKTLINILNEDPDYLSLLKVIQRARLVPTLNGLKNVTLFAPTNDAIEKYRSTNHLWDSIIGNSSFILTDNVQNELRQQLFYHLINKPVNLPNKSDPLTVLQTLHYPNSPPEPPTHDPPPYPPWIPVPGGTLGGEPQRLRVAARGKIAWVSVDVFGNGGAKVIKDRAEASNGVVFGIADVLEPPPDLATVVGHNPDVAYFHNVLTEEITQLLNSTTALTVFLPVNKAWESLDEYERLYLESRYATDDLNMILDMHAVVDEHVVWSEAFDPSVNLTTRNGTELEVVVTPEKTTVSTATLVQADIYASNGVLHFVDSLLIPPGAFKMTPEKYLLTLDCSKFVALIHESNLTFLISDTEAKYTILAPSDDVISFFGDDGLPERGSKEMKKMLQYHFIPGHFIPKKLKSGMLVETTLEEEGLDGRKQVIAVEANENDDANSWKSLKFGGASVVREPVQVNNVLIYFISKPVTPPSDALDTALPMLDYSSFVAAILSTSIGDMLKKAPRTTLLLPDNGAFTRLGLLVSKHLLAASNKPDLERVLLHHALATVQYADALQNGTKHSFATLENSDLTIDRKDNGTVFVRASGGWAGMKSEIRPRNILTQTGVIHELSDILLPRSVELNVGKLVKAADGSTMASLLVKAGFGWVLNGTRPPEDSPWADKELDGAGWTLLCPIDSAFGEYNLTELSGDKERLVMLVSQHLIPTPSKKDKKKTGETLDIEDPLNNNRPLLLEESVTYSTLRSPSSAYGDVVFKKNDEASGGYIVGIKNARGTDGKSDWAKVEAWGRSSNGKGTGGVIQIDRLLEPYRPPWWLEYGAPTLVGAIGVFLICVLFYIVRLVWRRDTTEATYEPGSSSESTTEKANNVAAENIKAFIAGGFGGVCAVLVGHPFDLTKTRLQTAPAGTYTGALDVVKKALARDGVTGQVSWMYRGIVPPLLGVTPIFAASFWAYDASKQLIYAMTPNRKNERLSTAELAAAGFLSAVPTTAITAPVERAKVLLQVQGQGGTEQKYKGVLDVIRHLYKEGGLRSIFRGSGATLMRDGPGSAVYFAAYEVTKKALTPAGSSPADLNLGAIVTAGGTAGVAMWAFAIPPDVIKSRIQSAPTGTYSGFMDCARKTIAQDGVKALFKGLGPAMARAFPANAATFLGVEVSRKFLDSISPSSSGKKTGKRKPATRRAPSASEIAKNIKHFETWSTHQNLEQAEFNDLPEELLEDVKSVFNTSAIIPLSWIKEWLLSCSSPELVSFILEAHETDPEMFFDDREKTTNRIELLSILIKIFSAWESLERMLASSERFSEADFVASVYVPLRSPSITESTQRVQPRICLPQPCVLRKLGSNAALILSTKLVIPDTAILIPTSSIKHLSSSASSPYIKLKTAIKSGNASKGSSFRYQATIFDNLSEPAGFEFASSFWEDKKPQHQSLEDAYRQNRMSTASAARQLHSLHVQAPIFGLVWCKGIVKAHVDFVGNSGVDEIPTVFSAPYVRPRKNKSSGDGDGFEWHLERPGDIIQVHFLVRNIDRWTTGRFRERALEGIQTLVEHVRQKKKFVPWRRCGDIVPTAIRSSRKQKENVLRSSSHSSESISEPSIKPGAKSKPRTRR